MKYSSLVLAYLLALPLYAQDAEFPCAGDINKHCQEFKGERKKVRECLMENENKLAPACAAKIKGAKAVFQSKTKDITANCKEDMNKLCQKETKEKEGKGSVLKCLVQNKTKLSEKCKASLPNKI